MCVWLWVVNPSSLQLGGDWTGGWVGVFLVLAEGLCVCVSPGHSGPGRPTEWRMRGEIGRGKKLGLASHLLFFFFLIHLFILCFTISPF